MNHVNVKIIFLQIFLHMTFISTIYIHIIIIQSSEKCDHIYLKITSISIPYKFTLI